MPRFINFRLLLFSALLACESGAFLSLPPLAKNKNKTSKLRAGPESLEGASFDKKSPGDDIAAAAARARAVAARLSEAYKPARVVSFSVRPLETSDVATSFSRSGGAGGQNVNKVNTKAEVRLNLQTSTFIPGAVLAKLEAREASRISKDGELVVTSSRHRTQAANLKDAMQKLEAIIDEAAKSAAPPKEPSKTKVARIKKLARKGNQKRLETKKKNTEKKTARKKMKNADY